MKRWYDEFREEMLTGGIGGLLLAFSFPPYSTRVFVCFALVPLLRYHIVRIDRPLVVAGDGTGLRRFFFVGYLTGFVCFMLMLHWVANLIPASSASMPWILGPAVVILSLYLALYTGLFSLATAALARRWGRAALVAVPALWALTEFMRGRGEIGFPWGLLSSALAVYPEAIQGLSIYGTFGLGFVIVMINLLIAAAFFMRSRRVRAFSLVLLIAVVVGHLAWGRAEIRRVEKEGKPLGGTAAIIQPNLDLAVKWKRESRDSIFADIAQLTHEAAGKGASLVIFPETAAPISFRFATVYRELLRQTAMRERVDLLIGHVDHTEIDGEWHAYNSASLFESDGALQATYHKVNLLPFGERIPFSQFFPVLSKIDFGQANFLPGKEAVVFETGVGKFGVLICFESAFSYFARDYVSSGADILVNITNDGWFGSRRGPKQHAELAILRAVENRVPLYRAANTGISMVVEPTGRISARIALDKRGMILTRSYRDSGPSFFSRHGHATFFVMTAVSLAAVLLVGAIRRTG
jgi:apolipoprotein N-acyltransferase